MARVDLVRDRRPQHEIRGHRQLLPQQDGLVHEQLPARVSVQQRHPQPAHDVGPSVHHRLAHAAHGDLCAGAVDARAADAPGRNSLRPGNERFPRSAARARAVHPDTHSVPRAGWDRIQRHLTEVRRRLRSARQREDSRQVHGGPLPRSVQRGGHLFRTQPNQPALHVHDPLVDRCQRQLSGGLRPAEPRTAGPSRLGR